MGGLDSLVGGLDSLVGDLGAQLEKYLDHALQTHADAGQNPS